MDEKGLPENYIIPSLGKLNIQVNKRTKGKVTRVIKKENIIVLKGVGYDVSLHFRLDKH